MRSTIQQESDRRQQFASPDKTQSNSNYNSNTIDKFSEDSKQDCYSDDFEEYQESVEASNIKGFGKT